VRSPYAYCSLCPFPYACCLGVALFFPFRKESSTEAFLSFLTEKEKRNCQPYYCLLCRPLPLAYSPLCRSLPLADSPLCRSLPFVYSRLCPSPSPVANENLYTDLHSSLSPFSVAVEASRFVVCSPSFLSRLSCYRSLSSCCLRAIEKQHVPEKNLQIII
jgi:hypothetical protein